MTPRGSLVQWFGALARNLVRGRRRDDDLRANIDGYVDLLTDELIAAGQSPEAACRAPRNRQRRCRERARAQCPCRRAAGRRRTGHALCAPDDAQRSGVHRGRRRDARPRHWREHRNLQRGECGAAEAAALCDADEIVVVWERNTAIGKERDPVAALNYLDWRRENTVLEELGAYRFGELALDEVSGPEQLRALSLSSSVFRVLSASAAIGRVFTEEEEPAAIRSSSWRTDCGSVALVEMRPPLAAACR